MRKKRALSFVAALLCLVLFATLAMTACAEKDHGNVAVMEISKQPAKTDYLTGELFDPSGMELIVQYEDGYVDTVTEGFTWDITDPLEEDDDEIILRYKNKSVLVFINITVKVPTLLEVETPPDKTVYVAGERFDKTGMTLRATYTDGTSEVVTDGFRVSPSGRLSLGTKSVRVTYNKATLEYPITVGSPKPLSMKITEMPRTEYNEGERFDPSGMVIEVTYSDGSVNTASAYDWTPKGELTTEDKSVTILCEGLSQEIPVTVSEVPLRISVTADPAKTVYDVGENFDPTGMEVTKYENGVPTVLSSSDYTITGGESLTVGSIVQVKLNGTEDDITATVPVNVVSVIDAKEEMVLDDNGQPVGRDNLTSANETLNGMSNEGDFLCNFVEGDRLTFKFDSTNALKATLAITASSTWTEKYSAINQYWPMIVNNMVANTVFEVYVNGSRVPIADDVLIFGGSTSDVNGDVRMFAQYSNIELANVDLKAGENVVEFVFLEQIYKNATFGSSREENEGTQLASIYMDYLTINAGAVLHDHEYGEPVVVREATCVSTGKAEQTCSICGAVKPIAIPKLDHSYGEPVTVEATCAHDGETYEVCEYCGKKHVISSIPALTEHAFTKTAVIVTGGVEVLVRSCDCGENTQDVSTSGTITDLKASNLAGQNTIAWATGDLLARKSAECRNSGSATVQAALDVSTGKDYITNLYGGSRIEVPLSVEGETTGAVAVKASSGWINGADWANSKAKTGDMRFNKVFKAYLRHSDGSTTEIAIGDDVILTGATGNYSIMANWQYVVFDGLTLSAGDTFVLESLTPMENGAYLYWDSKTAPVVVPDGSVREGNTQSTPNVDTITVFTGV